MTTFRFQTHVSKNGEITLPPIPKFLHGKEVNVTIERIDKNQPAEEITRKTNNELLEPGV